MDEEEIIHHHHSQFAPSKLPGTKDEVVNSAIHHATSVHELHECPVCVHSYSSCLLSFFFFVPFLVLDFVLAFFLNFLVRVSNLWQFDGFLSMLV